MNLPEIPSGATIRQWQAYMAELVKARGWDAEEVGELAKAYRRHRALFAEGQPESDTRAELAGELADVLSYLLDIAQRLDVDLESALIDKEHHNRGREWS